MLPCHASRRRTLAGLAAIVGYGYVPKSLLGPSVARLGVFARACFDWPNDRRRIDRLCTLNPPFQLIPLRFTMQRMNGKVKVKAKVKATGLLGANTE